VIYEGAVIRRLVTPNHPGDPTLDDPRTEIQCRVEYVRDDAKAPAPGSWTCGLNEAYVYPRHLDADRRAKEIGGNCFARVITRESNAETGDRRPDRNCSAINLSGGGHAGRTSGACSGDRAPEWGLRGESTSPAQNILPAVESSSSGRAPEQLRRDNCAGKVRSSSRAAAGKTSSARKGTERTQGTNGARLDALRASAERTRKLWYEEGQYA
jgi:hypothetical protein